MESNLAYLIEYFEKEKDRLEAELQEAIDLWDFEIAEAIKGSLKYVRDKLRVFKNLKNPYAKKIESLEDQINRTLEIDQYPEGMFPNSDYQKSWIKRQTDREKENKERNIKELELLKSIRPRDIVDSDIVLNLIGQLRKDAISKIGFEILDTSLMLLLHKVDRKVFVSLISNNNRKIDDYLHRNNRKKLKTLGFNPVSYIKEIFDFEVKSDLSLLQDISIIMYDVFSSYGDLTIEVHIMVE